MGTFRDLRYGQFSSRTLIFTLLIIGVVVGLFFIPEIIKFQRSLSSARTQAATRAAPPVQEEKASVSSSALQEISSQADKGAQPTQQQKQEDVTKVQPKESFWSGWSLKVRARGDNASAPRVTATLQDLNSREAQNMFGRARGDFAQFSRELRIVPKQVERAIDELAKALEAVASGAAKNVDQAALRRQLIILENNTVRTMLAFRVDRGLIIKWGQIPAIQIIESGNPSKIIQRIEGAFAPRILLRDVQIREQNFQQFGGVAPSFVNAQFGVRGSDVERIVLYISGLRKQEISLGNPDAEGYRSFALNGSAQGVYTLIAYDKYGARPFMKSYRFLPQARRFSQAPDGSYQVAFKSTPTMTSLDRFFTIGSSRAAFKDSGISSF